MTGSDRLTRYAAQTANDHLFYTIVGFHIFNVRTTGNFSTVLSYVSKKTFRIANYVNFASYLLPTETVEIIRIVCHPAFAIPCLGHSATFRPLMRIPSEPARRLCLRPVAKCIACPDSRRRPFGFGVASKLGNLHAALRNALALEILGAGRLFLY